VLQHLRQLARHVAALGAQVGDVVHRLARQDLLGRRARERRPTEQGEVGDGAQGVQIGPLVDVLTEQLLRGRELRRPAA
jgi:hypothetical protein